jgi:hypothetical protein
MAKKKDTKEKTTVSAPAPEATQGEPGPETDTANVPDVDADDDYVKAVAWLLSGVGKVLTGRRCDHCGQPVAVEDMRTRDVIIGIIPKDPVGAILTYTYRGRHKCGRKFSASGTLWEN